MRFLFDLIYIMFTQPSLKNFVIILLIAIACQASLTAITGLNYTFLDDYCKKAPLWKLNMCNQTCSSCSFSNSNACTGCPKGFDYDSINQHCLLQKTPDLYFYKTYLQSNPFLQGEVQTFKSDVNHRLLNLTSTVRICLQKSYNFNMLGLFQSSQTVVFSINYTQSMSYFRVKMSILSSQYDSKFTLTTQGNGQLKSVSQNINTTLDGQYYTSTNNKQSNILRIPGLTSQSLGSIIRTYTFQIFIKTKQVTFYLQCLSSAKNPFWAVSDITVLAMQCNTCITTQLQTKIDGFGRFALYLAIVTIPLISFFVCYVQLKIYFSWRLKHKQASRKQIPLKTIDRMVNSINLQAEKQYQAQRRSQLLQQNKKQKEDKIKQEKAQEQNLIAALRLYKKEK